MSDLDLAAIKARCAAATPGPAYDGGAALVAAARTDVPALVAEVERLRSDLAECYRFTGADPDGNDDAMLARKAVNAVRRLRKESDHQGERADEFAEEVKTMAGERDAARAATVKKLRDDLAEAAGVNAANLNALRSVRERIEELEAISRECLRDYSNASFTDRYGMVSRLRALLAKGGAA